MLWKGHPYVYMLCIDRPFTYLIFYVFIGVGGGLQNSESFSSFAGDPSKLSDQELDCLKEAFSLFDADHDGEITINELGRVMRNHGLNPTDDELRGISKIYCHYRRPTRKSLRYGTNHFHYILFPYRYDKKRG